MNQVVDVYLFLSKRRGCNNGNVTYEGVNKSALPRPGAGAGLEDIGPPVFWMRLSPTEDHTGTHKILVNDTVRRVLF